MIRWERLASMLFCAAVAAVAAVGLFRYVLPILFPFLLAWLLSLAVRPTAARIAAHFGIPQKLCALLLLLLLLGGTAFFLWAAMSRLLYELESLLEPLLADGGAF